MTMTDGVTTAATNIILTSIIIHMAFLLHIILIMEITKQGIMGDIMESIMVLMLRSIMGLVTKVTATKTVLIDIK